MKTISPHASKTQAESGDITPAAAHRSTSLASSIPGEGAAVVEPPKPATPAAAGSDEKNHFVEGSKMVDDDSDPCAFPRSRRLICSASNDGQTTIHRFGDIGIVLTRSETRHLYQFLSDTLRVWGPA